MDASNDFTVEDRAGDEDFGHSALPSDRNEEQAESARSAAMPETDGIPDTMGLELALQFQDIEGSGFETAVAAAVDSIGGELLFEMPLPAETECQRVAAISIGSGDGRLLMLVLQPVEGETLRVETVEHSSHPVAGIVAAYAGLMPHFAAAA
jgi:hypothetical protein